MELPVNDEFFQNRLLRLSFWLIPLAVLAFVGYAYYVFVVVLCLGEFFASPTTQLLFLAAFHVCLFLFLLYYGCVVFTDPGFVSPGLMAPDDESCDAASKELVRLQEDGPCSADLGVRVSGGGDSAVVETATARPAPTNVCQRCRGMRRPERSHHCSMCGRCVMKMDHHCPWINNCVGLRNQKFFVLFLASTALLCTVGLARAAQTLIRTDWSDLHARSIHTLVLAVLAAMFLLFAALLGGQHVYFVLANCTNVEQLIARQRHGNFTYDMGMWRNWKQVFGATPLEWLLPVPTATVDGVNWPRCSLEVVDV
mmetsp:Transcript_36533/g.91592  ORF Transcript_36533/g.91592 Transcript_36533/m.91592 type:complete len:311 (-) Transcript_36533:11-943(-)